MHTLVRLGIGTIAGTLSMGLVLGVLESEVNPRRMLFIGAMVGLGTAGLLEAIPRTRQPSTPQTAEQALTFQLARPDISADQAIALAEQLAQLHLTQTEGARLTTHHTPKP
jgi:hypothetical protein